jgi:hypothetical protein
VVRLDLNGNLLWQKCIGGTNSDEDGQAAYQTPDGGYIVGGRSNANTATGDLLLCYNPPLGGGDYLAVKLSATGEMQWLKSVGGNRADALSDARLTKDGGFAMFGGYSGIVNTPHYGDAVGGVGGALPATSTNGTHYWLAKLPTIN